MNHSMIALVTGGNKGIGREIAAQLAGLGHTVLIGVRSIERGEEAAAELRAAGGDVTVVALDVTDPDSASAAAETVRSRFGRLDALINNAGISHQPGADFAGQLPRSADVDHVRYVFETNVFGVITVSSAFLPLLRRSDSPRIVNVSSSAGSLAAISDFANTDPIALGYAASKTAAHRGDHDVCPRPRLRAHPGQRRLPRIRCHRSEQPPRRSHTGRGSRISCPHGNYRARRAYWHVHRRPGTRRLVARPRPP